MKGAESEPFSIFFQFLNDRRRWVNNLKFWSTTNSDINVIPINSTNSNHLQIPIM